VQPTVMLAGAFGALVLSAAALARQRARHPFAPAGASVAASLTDAPALGG